MHIQLLDVPYSPTSFLVSTFFAASYSKTALIAFNLANLKINDSFEAQHGIWYFGRQNAFFYVYQLTFFYQSLFHTSFFFQNSRYIAIASFQFSWLQHFQQESHKLVSKWLFNYNSQNIFVWLLVQLWVQVLS